MSTVEGISASRGRWLGIVNRPALLFPGIAVAFGIAGYFLGDQINLGGGFGYDGRLYGSLAQHFPSIISGTGLVTRPWAGGPVVLQHGLDTYYALRIVPSALAYLILVVTQVPRTTANVVAAFSVLNVAALGVIGFCWQACAKRFRLSQAALWMGFVALLVNFAVKAGSSYMPVATDMTAYALGALSVLFWLRGSKWALITVTIVAAFAWPAQAVLGAIFLLWPYRAPDTSRPVGAESENPRIGTATGVAVVIALVAIRLHNVLVDTGQAVLQSSAGTFVVATAVAGAFAWWVVTPLIPSGRSWFVRQVLRPALSARRLGPVVGIAAIVLIGQHLIAVRAGLDSRLLLEEDVAHSTRFPGIFLVAAASWFGPIVIIGALMWRSIARDARRHGPGMVLSLGVIALGLLMAEPRTDTAGFFLMVLVIINECDRRYILDTKSVALFALLCLATSRLWLHIGPMPSNYTTSTLLHTVYTQKLFMGTGVWTSTLMYWIQLAAGLIVCLSLALVSVRLPRRVARSSHA